jgi:hypothetical protein
MGAFHDDRNTLRLQDLLDGHCYLLGQPLLQLQATSEHLGDSGKLGQA